MTWPQSTVHQNWNARLVFGVKSRAYNVPESENDKIFRQMVYIRKLIMKHYFHKIVNLFLYHKVVYANKNMPVLLMGTDKTK